MVLADPSGSYALSNNYDASSDGTYSNSPITTPLSGTFEGLGNTISNLKVSTEKINNTGGLFAEVMSGGSIENLGLSRLRFTATYTYRLSGGVGGLVGLNFGVLRGDHVGGDISSSGGGGTGGLVGANEGMIVNSYTTAKVVAESGSAGGLVADNDYGNAGTITGSFATGPITGGGAGGLVGQAGGLISNSYAIGDVAQTKPEKFAGGLIASGGSVSNSYSTGTVQGRKKSYLGGFVGDAFAPNFSNCYWDTTTSRMEWAAGEGLAKGVTGLTTEQLQSGLPTGFDPKIWSEKHGINKGLPYLRANPPPK